MPFHYFKEKNSRCFFLETKSPAPHTHTHAVTVTLTSWGETHLEKLITPEGDHAMLMLCGHRHLTVNWLHQFADHFLICWVAFTLLVGEVAIKANNNQRRPRTQSQQPRVKTKFILVTFTFFSLPILKCETLAVSKLFQNTVKIKKATLICCGEFMSLYISKIKFTDLFNGHLRLR